jgi:hypothetical protein
LFGADALQRQQVFTRNTRGVHFDGAIKPYNRFAGPRQSGAAAANAANCRRHKWRTRTPIKFFDRFPDPPVGAAENLARRGY